MIQQCDANDEVCAAAFPEAYRPVRVHLPPVHSESKSEGEQLLSLCCKALDERNGIISEISAAME